jgi:uncharacterized repeat protein (TIGR01451 family)
VKQTFIGIRSTAVRTLVGSFALLALLAFALPQAAYAATSGGATIYNTVKVTYLYGSTTLFATAHVSVTINTLAALPTVTNPANQTTVAGALVTYNYRLKSNSNGLDTYITTASSLTNTPTGISAVTGPAVTAGVPLWGGIALGSGAGTITVPNGSTTGLTAGTSTVQIGTSTYTVTAITPGAAAYTNSSGNLVAEVPTTLTLTLISGTAIIAGSVPAGTQVGEYKTAALVVTFTTGTPTVVGTDGTYSTTFTFSTGALPTVLSNTTTAVITTVTSASRVATLAKYVRNVTTSAAGTGTAYSYNSINYYQTSVTAKPGDILEYILVARNTGTVDVSAAVVTDVLPTSYVTLKTGVYGGSGKDFTYVPDSTIPATYSTFSAAAGDDAAVYNVATLTVNVGGTTPPIPPLAGGTIAAGKTVLVLYQVTVNNIVQGIVNSAQLSSPDITPVKSSVTVAATNSGVAAFSKYVRNVTTSIAGTGAPYVYGGKNYYLAGVTAKQGDILEYIMVTQNGGTGVVSAAVVTDILPVTYVSLKTGVYSGATEITYVDEAGTVSYLTAAGDTDAGNWASPTLTVNIGTGATNSAGGTIAAGKSVLVLYQVTVNNLVQGGTIINSAQLSSPDITPVKSSVTVTTTAISGVASFAKYVRNVTVPGGSGSPYVYGGNNYYLAGVTVKPGDILEYILIAKNTGTVDVSASVVTDVLPTSYVSLKTGVYSGATDITYVNDAGAASYLTAAGDTDAGSYAEPSLMVNVGTGATSSVGGTIPTGKSVLVLYQVNVNNPVQGDKIVNSVRLYSPDIISPGPTSAVIVTAVIRTKSVIEFLTYAPSLSGADLVNVSTTAYRKGSATTDPFVKMPAPVSVGTTTPIDLSHTVPLTASTQIHEGEPIFIRLTDLDQNLDKTVAETVLVTVSNPANGDIEVIRLTETGPDTGVFAGYLPTVSITSGPVTSYNGIMSVNAGDKLSVSYVDIMDPSDTSVTTMMVDPYGIVLDSSTGLPVNGATITIINTATGQPAAVFGDDGVSTFPATITSGGLATDSHGIVYSFPKGGYRFPFVLTGNYQYKITPPPGYGFPSTVATETIQALPGNPFTIVSGSRGEAFVINPGPSLRIDIPLDPGVASLWLQKSAGKDSAGQGDFIPYLLTLTNNSKLFAAGGVSVADTMPIGFRLSKGSVKINSVPSGNPTISADGRTLTFNVGTLAGGSVTTINYVAEVTAGTRLGEAINTAIATAAAGEKSNNAHATVTIRDDFMRTRSTLMGRVMTGACNDKTGEGTGGVEGVRVYLEDGSFVISDKRGMFHFEGVRAGLHVAQLDLDSLPDGYEAFACTENSRFAGRAFSQFVETQGGTLWRTDFHIRKKPAAEKSVTVSPPVATVPLKGEIVLELANTTQGQNIAYKVAMRGSSLPVQEARLNVILPEGVLYEPGSSMMDGVKIADPLQIDKTRLAFRLNDLPAGWRHEITFRGMLSRDSKSGTLVMQAYLAADGDEKAAVLTPPAETILQLDKNTEISQMHDIVLRPRFPVRSAELNAEDRKKLDELAGSLFGLRTEKIQVIGHTDNVPIAPSHRGQYIDNQALSLARAKSVGHYLKDKLRIPPEKLFLDGKGSAVPIADNRTEAGRTLNRRVEVRITFSRIIDHSHLRVLKENSGEQRTQITSPKDAPQGGNNRSSMAEPISVKQRVSRSVIFAFPDADQNEDEAPPRSDFTGSAAIKADAPSAAKAAAVPRLAASEVPAASAPETSEKTIKDPDGILSPGDNDILVNSINSIRVCLDSKLTPRLSVDKKEVPENRIGFTMKDEKAGKTIYSYIGIDFGKRGNHVVQFQGVDPFGNARFNQTISVKRSGEIVSIRMKSAQGNVADGKTPVKIRLELYDADGTRIPAGAELEIREGTLSPLKQPDIFSVLPSAGGHAHVQMSREGDVLFQPVNNSGPYRVVLGYNTATVEAETYVQPKMRDWILVGLAEGTVGYNTLSGNMENLQSANVDENLYKDGRVALFAKGQIKGKWLLTVAYDSAKKDETSRNVLFQTINPESYYTLYGDTSQQQYDAASTKKLYIKIEREQFYAMFGDYDTGLTVTELSRYSRRMTGVKTEMQTKNFEVNAFASQTDQSYAWDEIPGDGTSGIYRLSHKNILPNTEKITIEVRDRFHSEILISSRSMNRFTDYSIDYDTSAVIFKEPIYYRDQQLNPIIIVAEYEIVAGGGQDYTYGGRAGVKLFNQRLKAGGSYIHEGQGDRSSNLYGVDTSFKLDQTTKLRAEFATSDFDDGSASRSGNAYLAEVSRTTKIFDAKAYIREQAPGFGMGQQPGSEAGTRKYGVEGAYRFGDSLRTNGNIYRQDNLLTDATRDVAEGKLNYTSKAYSAYVGALHANDHLDDGSNHESNQLTLGGKIPTLNNRLNLTLDYAQSIGSNNNSDFPTRTVLGAEYKATKNLTLLAAQEFTWGSGATTQDTRLGMRSALWDGAALTSTVERQFNENDDRVFADVGLKQTWKINDAWKMDAGLERSQTIANSEHYQFNTNVQPASGTSGTNENFTSVSGGATYQVKQMTWENRLEFRLADSENKWGLMSGLVKEIDSSWAWSGRAQIYHTSVSADLDTTKVDLRYGLVYRPPQTQWIVLDRLDFIIDEQSGGTGISISSKSWRLVNNFITNYRPRKDLQLSLHYGAKYVQETIEGSDFSGYTDLLGVEGRYDITKDWDIGLQSSILHSWNSGQLDYCEGISIGYNVVQNAWISLGYNLTGFKDKDFSQAEFTAKGPFVRFRFKFDQNSVRDAAKWLGSY